MISTHLLIFFCSDILLGSFLGIPLERSSLPFVRASFLLCLLPPSTFQLEFSVAYASHFLNLSGSWARMKRSPHSVPPFHWGPGSPSHVCNLAGACENNRWLLLVVTFSLQAKLEIDINLAFIISSLLSSFA